MQQQAGRQGPERLSNRRVTNVEVIGAGLSSGGNTLIPEKKKMGTPLTEY